MEIELVEDYKTKKHKEYISRAAKSALEIKFDEIFNIESLDSDINIFNIKPKQSYYNNTFLYLPYINYFIEYYDDDNELLLGYLKLKFMIDRSMNKYPKELFVDDVFTYLLSDSMIAKIKKMVDENYTLNLNLKTGTTRYKAIEFNDDQGCILLQISMAIKIFIPIVTHFIAYNNINKKGKGKGTDAFLSDVFLKIIPYFEDGNLYNKMYEFIGSKINKFKRSDKEHWDKIEIFGMDIDSETEKILSKVFVDIFFKYSFTKNIIAMNATSIRNIIEWSLRTNFNLNLRPISDIKPNDDSLSEFDKMELTMSKFDESFVIMGGLNIKQTIKKLRKEYNIKKFDKDELDFYEQNLRTNIVQRDMIFKLFAKYFGNVRDLYSLSLKDYIKLIIIMKKIMHDMGFVILPHLLTGVMSINAHKKISKKQKEKIQNSKEFITITEKYNSAFDIITKDNALFKTIEVLLTSNVTLVDYTNSDKTGKSIDIANNSNLIIYEYMKYIEMI